MKSRVNILAILVAFLLAMTGIACTLPSDTEVFVNVGDGSINTTEEANQDSHDQDNDQDNDNTDSGNTSDDDTSGGNQKN